MILSSCGCKVSWALRGGVRLRRHKLHILRPAAGGRAHSFRCSSSPQKALRLSGDPFRFFGLQVIPTASKCGVTGVLFATAFASIPPPTGRENPPDSPGLSHRQICGFFDGDGDTESVCCQLIRLVRQPQERVTLLYMPTERRLTFVLISSARLV